MMLQKKKIEVEMMNTKISDFSSEKNKETIIINSDVYAGLDYLEDNSIQCAVTSPPYWGQRDYGFKGQIGNEKKYSEYIEKLEAIYRKLKEKLDSKGIFFLNIGDKYLSRYGNSKLGMIPYKLAKFMKDNGWILVDTIIWYKPNHMPGSYTNRFTSTYEPVFVFAKNKINYYSEYVKKNKNYSNVLKITLQATPYNHVAVYPEKLIESLLKLGFPKNSVILDPFAGSGTTAKAMQNLNQKEKYNMKSILIEASEEYVKIIKKRCNLSPKQEVIKLPFKEYETKKFEENGATKDFKATFDNEQKYSNNNIIKIFENNNDLLNFINEMKLGKVYNAISNTGILYLGIKNNNIDNIHLISTLNLYGWVIRNQLIIKEGKSWYPIYLIVKDTKKGKYNLNIDAVRVEHKDKQEKDWSDIDFVGYKVTNSLSKTKKEGIIVKVLNKYKDGMPSKVIVKWEDEKNTKECVKHNGYLNETAFSFNCPNCSNKLLDFYDEENMVSCPNCKIELWKNLNTIPKLNINGEIYPQESERVDIDVEAKNTKKDYNGKFKEQKQINFGASPGARSSTQETYFSVQRYYEFPQEMIADLLKILLENKKLSKKKLTEMFPESYLHTVGHWFRKDLGGSLPAPEDLNKTNEILNIPEEFRNLVNSRCLVLQAVKKSHKGKNPGDYLELNKNDALDFLKKSAED